MRGLPIKARVILLNAVITALLIGALGMVVRGRAESDLIARIDRQLESDYQRLEGITCADGSLPTPAKIAGGALFCVNSGPARVRIFDPSGKSLTEFRSDAPLLPLGASGVGNVVVHGVELRVISRRIGDRFLQFVYPLQDVRFAASSFESTLIAAIPIGLLMALVGGAFVTSRALRPLKTMAAQAESISAERFQDRLPREPGEFGDLAGTLNGMLDRLEASYREQATVIDRQRRFIADASHELRTPLTIIKGSTALALSGDRSALDLKSNLRRIDTAADTLVGLSEDLLTLVRNEAAEAPSYCEATSLSCFLAGAVEPFGEQVRLSVEGDGHFCADHDALRRVLWNLIRNALTHGGSEVPVHVSAEASDHVLIKVTDHGKGIPAEELEKVFERFYQLDPSRSGKGAGLGLSICKEIVQRHGGRIWMESEPGRGTKVSIVLPLFEGLGKANEGLETS